MNSLSSMAAMCGLMDRKEASHSDAPASTYQKHQSLHSGGDLLAVTQTHDDSDHTE